MGSGNKVNSLVVSSKRIQTALPEHAVDQLLHKNKFGANRSRLRTEER